MKVRYIGADEGRLVPLPDGDTAHVARREWLDTSAEHARSLAQSDEWELEAVVKARRTRRTKNAEQAEQPTVEVAEEVPAGEHEETAE